jgi:septal ring factor EnvC (AmiA/AmiB activator)
LHPFADWTLEQLISLIACVTGIVMMLMAVRRDSESDRDRQAAHAAEQQVITDKLDSIADMSKETRDTVREMSKQLSEHSRELARIETRIEDHDRRLAAIEGRCDLHRTAGTD